MAYDPDDETKKKDDGNGTAIAVVVGGLVVGAIVTGIALAAGGSKKEIEEEEPVPEPPPPDPPVDPPPVDPPPVEPPEGEPLQFDLLNNWGGVPADMREVFAKLELAFGIPGIGRFGAVKAWQAFHANQPYIPQDQVAAIWAANPFLNKDAIAEIDADKAKELLDKNIAAGWPTPKDYDGWRLGSFGFFDILGPNIVWAGIHVLDAADLPYLNMNAVEAGANLQVQCGTLAYMVWRILNAPGYQVLKPGPNSAAGDSLNTWGNTASAYASPSAYIAQSEYAKQAKAAFLERALELGIDLAKNAYPWPPGKKYGKADFKWGEYVKRLQDYANRPIVHNGNPAFVPPQPPAPPAPPLKNPPFVENLIDVGGGIKARLFDGAPPNENAPLLVVLHGRNANENQLYELVTANLKKGARIAFLRGPKGSGSSWRWFDLPLSAKSPALDNVVMAARDQVLAAIFKLANIYPATSEVAVLGYSQGGTLAYALAAGTQQKAKTVSRVIAVAGWLPPGLRPTGALPATVYGIHGKKDKNVPWQRAQATMASFAGKAPLAVLDLVEGGGHDLASLNKTIRARLVQ